MNERLQNKTLPPQSCRIRRHVLSSPTAGRGGQHAARRGAGAEPEGAPCRPRAAVPGMVGGAGGGLLGPSPREEPSGAGGGDDGE
jgi:hypothetical protein